MFIVNLAGHLGKDPETRFTPSGQKVTSFTIATNHRKGKEDVTIWVRVTVWGDRFDKLISYLKKGSGVVVTGRMNPPSSYTDKEGRTQISLEVTAEMIEFSPFGRTDRMGEGQTQNASGSSHVGSSHDASQAAPQYDETQFQMNHAPQYGKSHSSYGSHTAGQGHHQSQSVDEDNLPF
jgi:single-strand DNA-binding protein